MCPSIQFVLSTPFAVYYRAGKEHHRLERRGKGWYADLWKRHIGRAAHKRRPAEWVQDGGDKIRQEGEPQQWKCVYWRGEGGKMKESIVSLQDGNGAELLLDLRAGWPRYVEKSLVVDLSCEEDMIQSVRRLGDSVLKSRNTKARNEPVILSPFVQCIR
ncbi:hypothetical protein NMY22_g19483 [Coprinellus aureogranulatus]|nr:hypothetical protein NMY22_g19483 [Coprinellus aureogranulatus]